MKNFSFFRLFCLPVFALLYLCPLPAQNADTAASDTLEFRPLFGDALPAGSTGRRRIHTRSSEAGAQLVLDRNGHFWKTFGMDGLKILMNVRYQKHFGQYYRIDLYIENDTDAPVLFDFRHSKVATPAGAVPLYSHDRYLDRIRSRKGWKTFGISMGALFTSFFVSGILNSDSAWGRADSIGEEILEDLASIAIQEAGYIASAMVSAKEAEDMERIVRTNVGYLDSYNILPGTALEGHAYAKYQPGAQCIDIMLPVGGKDYIFQWDTRELVNVADES